VAVLQKVSGRILPGPVVDRDGHHPAIVGRFGAEIVVERQHREARGRERSRGQGHVGRSRGVDGNPGAGAAVGAGHRGGPGIAPARRYHGRRKAAHGVGVAVIVYGQGNGAARARRRLGHNLEGALLALGKGEAGKRDAPAIQQGVGGQNGVAAIEKTGLAGLQLQALHHELQGHGIAAAAGAGVEVGLNPALHLNNIPGHVPERGAPYFANVVDLRAGGHVGIREGVHRQAGAVGVAPDATCRRRLALYIRAHGPSLGAIGGLGRGPVGGHHQGKKVAPALASLLGIVEAAGIGAAAAAHDQGGAPSRAAQDDNANGAGRLRGLHLQRIRAGKAVDKGDFAGEASRAGAAGIVGDGAGAGIVEKHRR
nr:hypothetical protein [Tanacetum cinerariifolium]